MRFRATLEFRNNRDLKPISFPVAAGSGRLVDRLEKFMI